MKEVIIAAVLTLGAAPVLADVTVQQSFALDALGFVKAHGTGDELTTADKQRSDTEFHCEGIASLLCGSARSGDIVRLDRNLSWGLQPDKKLYTETPFPTPEERAQAQQRLQAAMEKMKQCQQKQSKQPAQNPADTSDCDLSPLKIDVNQTDERATVAGHDTRKSTIKLSQTCTDRKTGDVCEYDFTLDSWLTSDTLAGTSDRVAFGKAYMAAMGLDPTATATATKGVVQMALASYGPQLKELSTKASALKGYPLRTTIRVIFGGPKCGRSQQQSTTSSDDSASSSSPPTSLSGLAGNLGAKAFGNFLSKRNANTDSGTQSAAAANAAPTLPDGFAQAVAFTTETTSINTGPIAPEQFEIPAGWTLQTPKPNKSGEDSCPTEK